MLQLFTLLFLTLLFAGVLIAVCIEGDAPARKDDHTMSHVYYTDGIIKHGARHKFHRNTAHDPITVAQVALNQAIAQGTIAQKPGRRSVQEITAEAIAQKTTVAQTPATARPVQVGSLIKPSSIAQKRTAKKEPVQTFGFQPTQKPALAQVPGSPIAQVQSSPIAQGTAFVQGTTRMNRRDALAYLAQNPDTTLRDAEKITGVPFSTLSYWKRHA